VSAPAQHEARAAAPDGVRVKICGITSPEDALAAERAGADAIGMILYGSSRRLVDLARAAQVVAPLGPFLTRVGVVVDAPASLVHEAIDRLRLDAVQFHGSELAEEVAAFRDRVRCIKAVPFGPGLDLAELARFPADAILIDGLEPGSGRPFAWGEADGLATLPRWILAGGLTPETVGAAVARLRPYAVDVASGVERSPGVKDHAAVVRFVTSAKGAP
jgi:phosphoribosylanthranilate isomerase